MNYHDLEPEQKNALVAWKIMGWHWVDFDFYDVTTIKHQFWLLPNVLETQTIPPGEWTWFLENEEGDPIGNRIIVPSMMSNFCKKLDSAWRIVERMVDIPTDPTWRYQYVFPPGTHFANWFDHACLWSYTSASEVADEICKQALIIMHVIREDGEILIDLVGEEEEGQERKDAG